MAIRKGSPYGEFMQNVILKMSETGQLDWMISSFDSKAKPQDCKTGLAKGNPFKKFFRTSICHSMGLH
jgi:hypothetical protein